MGTLRTSDVVGLARRFERWCVTITLPPPSSPGNRAERSILVDNAIRDAEEMLLDRGVRPVEASARLAPLRRHAADPQFGRDGGGVAAYLSSPEACVFRLGGKLRRRVFVGERHLVLPLLGELERPERFYVLALSQNAVRLIRASQDGTTEIPLAEEATSLDRALGGYDPDPQVQYHTASAPPGRGGGRAAPVFHGAGLRPHKVDLERFLRRVDGEVAARLRGDDAPVVLAGVDYLVALYRGVSRLSGPLEGTIEGSTDAKSADELQRSAAALLEPEFRARRGAAIAACRETLGRGGDRAAATLAAIVPAAASGRVATLLVARGARRVGTFDRARGEIAFRDAPRGADDDLVDLAATETFLNRGLVHVVPADEVPGGGPAAAILRY